MEEDGERWNILVNSILMITIHSWFFSLTFIVFMIKKWIHIISHASEWIKSVRQSYSYLFFHHPKIMKNIQKNEKYKSRDLKLKSAKVLPKAKNVRFFTNFSELFQFSILIKYVIEVAIFLFFCRKKFNSIPWQVLSLCQ